MAEQVRAQFGTTAEEIEQEIHRIAERNHWDKSRVYYVIDINSCTVRETVYAVSNRTADLPLHPVGPRAVQKLVP